MPRPLVCLVPVKNEAWILDLFLRATSLWADHIIVADQASDDGSRDIVARHPKAILIDNPSPVFNEPERQALLIAEARARFPGSILFALDADEILTPEWMGSPDWDALRAAAPGTVVRLRWANVRPGMRWYWIGRWVNFAFVDDGATPHRGKPIHSPRVPLPEGGPVLSCRDLRVIHYRSYDWARMESKHRWYQCWERLNGVARDPVAQYRFYHSVDAPRLHKLRRVPTAWLEAYAARGVDLRAPVIEGVYRWDLELLAWFAAHGTAPFRKQAVWDVDWEGLRRARGGAGAAITDPRTVGDRAVHAWLRGTQPLRKFPPVQLVDWLLRRGWAGQEPLTRG